MRIIEGEITLTTPLFIASTEDMKINNDGYIISSGSAGSDAKSVTTMIKTPVALKEPITITDNDDNVVKSIPCIDVPTINSNLLRGRIRRECANLIFESLCDREETISLSMGHVLTCLSTSGSPSGDNIIRYSYLQQARSHLFAGLWGGGANMLRSGISVFDAKPLHHYLLENNYVEYGCRHNVRDELAVNTQWNKLGHLGLTYVTHQFKKDDVLHFSCPILDKVVTDFNKEVPAYQDAVVQLRKDAKAKVKLGLDNMFGFESVMPGVSFTFRMEFKDHINDEQVGFILLALDRLKTKQGLGGSTRYGMGRFDFNFNLYEANDDSTYIVIDDEITDEYKSQAQLAINNISEDDLLGIYEDKAADAEKQKAYDLVAKKKSALNDKQAATK